MGIFGRAIDVRAMANNGATSGVKNPASWFVNWAMGGRPTASGTNVNEFNAMQINAVFACVRILSKTLASLPLEIYRRLEPRGKQKDRSLQLYRVLHSLANPEMTSYDLRQTMMGHLALWGNAYAEVVRNGAGDVTQLWPLRPDQVQVERADGFVVSRLGLSGPQEVVYRVHLPDGTQAVLPRRNIMHVRGLSSNGLVGLSPISQARESIGLAMATEEYGARFFSNGAQPAGVLTHPGAVTDTAKTNMRSSWEEIYGGLSNSHRVAILEEGVTYTQIGMPNEDAQFLDTRKFQVEEIARIFDIPLVLLQHHENSTSWGTGIEQFMLGFVKFTMRPWFVCWEQAMHRDLFTQRQRETHFAEFNVEGLLRGDLKSRADAYRILREIGVLSANEIRDRENFNPREDEMGDEFWRPSNMEVDGALEDEDDEPMTDEAERVGVNV